MILLLCKALLVALAGLLAVAIIAVAAILGIAYWISRGDYSLGADADSSGLCDCPDCVNHSGLTDQARAVSTPAPSARLREPHSTCAARTSLLAATRPN